MASAIKRRSRSWRARPKYRFAPLLLAPPHQLVAAKPAIAKQCDPHVGPTMSNLPDDARDLAQAGGRRVDIGAAQPHSHAGVRRRKYSNPPESVVMVPPSNRAVTWREKWTANPNSQVGRSVIEMLTEWAIRNRPAKQ
jgi:hypothetical protein